jgi:hypothetical protein
MKGHVKNKLQLRRLAKDCFMDSLPLPRRELPSAPGFLSCFLSALRAAAVVPFRSLGYLSFRFLPLVVLPETLSLLRFAWLADWVAICQPGFYWRLKAYSYLRSCEGAYSEARSSSSEPTLGTQSTLILSLDLLQSRLQ